MTNSPIPWTTTEQVQTLLGVRVDGIWGPKTSTAYDNADSITRSRTDAVMAKVGYSPLSLALATTRVRDPRSKSAAPPPPPRLSAPPSTVPVRTIAQSVPQKPPSVPKRLIDGALTAVSGTARAAPAPSPAQVQVSLPSVGVKFVDVPTTSGPGFHVEGGKYLVIADPSQAAVKKLWWERAVPAIVIEAKRRGANVTLAMAQMMAETAGGTRVGRWPGGPLKGQPNYNFGGVKLESVKFQGHKSFTSNMTTEDFATRVRLKQAFAAYRTPEEFVSSWFSYMFQKSALGKYRTAALLSPTVDGWIENMVKSKYATDKDYQKVLRSAYNNFMKKPEYASIRDDIVRA